MTTSKNKSKPAKVSKTEAKKAKQSAVEKKNAAAVKKVDSARDAAKKTKITKLEKEKNEAIKNKSSDKNYLVTLTVNQDKVFKSEEKDLVDAILGLKPDVVIKTKALISVTHGKLSTEYILLAKQLRKPLLNRESATFLAKQIEGRLK